MTLYRYMSAEEAIALFIDKQTLTNTTDSYRDINPSTLQVYRITGFTHITAEPLPNPLLPQPR